VSDDQQVAVGFTEEHVGPSEVDVLGLEPVHVASRRSVVDRDSTAAAVGT
jgi:hypothetical protein